MPTIFFFILNMHCGNVISSIFFIYTIFWRMSEIGDWAYIFNIRSYIIDIILTNAL